MRWHSRKYVYRKYSSRLSSQASTEKVTLVFHTDQKHLDLMKTGVA